MQFSEMAEIFHDKQIACNILYWMNVSDRLVKAGLIGCKAKLICNYDKVMTELAVKGVFPDISEQSLRYFFAAQNVAAGPKLESLVTLFLHCDEIT